MLKTRMLQLSSLHFGLTTQVRMLGDRVKRAFATIATIVLFAHSLSSHATSQIPTAAQQEAREWFLQGTVTDSLGKPLEGAQVMATASERVATTTNADGHYAIAGLKTGTYGVLAQKDKYVPLGVRRVQLVPGRRVNLDLKLDPEAAISGRIVRRDDTPLRGIRIDVWAKSFGDGKLAFPYVRGTVTDNSGKYRIAGLSQGTYYILATGEKLKFIEHSSELKQKHAHQLAYPALFYPGETAFENATPVHLRRAEQRDGIDFTLDRRPSFCAFGTLGNVAGTEDTRVLLTEEAQGWSQMLASGRSSLGKNFEVCGLIPGVRYALTGQIWGEANNLRGFAKASFETNKDAAEMGFLDLGAIPVQAGQPVSGHITIEGRLSDQQFPPGVLVTLERANSLPGYLNETSGVEVQDSGNFLFTNIFPYEHWLRLYKLPPGYYIKQATYDRYDLLREPWQRGAGDVCIVLALDGASVYGEVVDGKAEPVDDAQVILVSKEKSGNISVQSVDQDSHFRFPSVIPGGYRVLAISGITPVEAQNPELIRRYLSHARELNLGPKGQQSLNLTVLNASQ